MLPSLFALRPQAHPPAPRYGSWTSKALGEEYTHTFAPKK